MIGFEIYLRYRSLPSLQVLFSNVYSSVLFKVIVTTRISHASKEIACVVLLWSLDFIVSISRGFLRELTIQYV